MSELPMEGAHHLPATLPSGANFCESIDSDVTIQNQSYSFTCLVTNGEVPYLYVFFENKEIRVWD